MRDGITDFYIAVGFCVPDCSSGYQRKCCQGQSGEKRKLYEYLRNTVEVPELVFFERTRGWYSWHIRELGIELFYAGKDGWYASDPKLRDNQGNGIIIYGNICATIPDILRDRWIQNYIYGLCDMVKDYRTDLSFYDKHIGLGMTPDGKAVHLLEEVE